MKKLIFLLLISPIFLKAQSVPDSTTIPKDAKVAIISHFIEMNIGSYDVDFGGPLGKRFLKDKKGMAMTFTSYFEALKYMESQGWEYVGTFNDVGIDKRTDQVILLRRK